MSVKRLRLALALAGLAGGVFSFDRWTKIHFFSEPEQTLIPFWLSLTHHQNRGLLANIAVPMPLILGLTILISLGLIFAIVQELKQTTPSTTRSLAYALILGGAIGNVVDRLMYGFVFDWILLCSRSIINIADIAIGLGILLWVFHYRLTDAPKNESSI